MKNKIRVGRLRRLAKHLRGKNRVHKKFVFDIIAKGKIKDGNYCGTAGCAVAEFPALWPKEWSWEQDNRFLYDVLHKSQDINDDTDNAVIAKFFSITGEQAYHLFIPGQQDMVKLGGKWLEDDATPEQVADNIDAFIKKVAS